MNSLLQCLFSTLKLRDYFITNAYKNEKNSNSRYEGQFAETFADLFKKICSTGINREDTKRFFDLFGKLISKFNSAWVQEDPQEFWLHFRKCLYQDLENGGTSQIKELFQGRYEMYTECDNESCTVKHYLTSDTDLQELHVYLKKSASSCNLEDLVENLQKPSSYTAKENCNKCGSKARKNVAFVSVLPQVLIMQLCRFNDDSTKSKIHITFPLNFNSSAYFPDAEERAEYNLYAVCYHIGNTTTSGHYMASCKIGDQWYLFDDTKIYKIGEAQVERPINNTAFQGDYLDSYLLFYSKNSL